MLGFGFDASDEVVAGWSVVDEPDDLTGGPYLAVGVGIVSIFVLVFGFGGLGYRGEGRLTP